MKVRVDYSDGTYWLTEYTPKHAAAKLAYVDIDDTTWEGWQAHCEESRKWHAICRDLGNEQYDKEAT